MPIHGFLARLGPCVAVVATLAGPTPAAVAATPVSDPVFVAQILVSDGPGTSFVRRFEGLGPGGLVHIRDGRAGVDAPRGEVHLFRAFTRSRDWWDWRQLLLDSHGRQGRHDATIVLFDQTLAEVARWELKGAWPQGLKVSLAPDGSVQEELVLAHGSVSLVNPPSTP